MQLQLTVIVLLASLISASGLSVSTAEAQSPAPRTASAKTPQATSASMADMKSMADVKLTPEMWFYIQERQRYDTPKYAVRRNAEQAGAQRAQRLAAQQWLGQSPERPSVYATPFGGYLPGTFPYTNNYQWNSYFTVGSTPWQPNR